jgi:hypothetical protein
MNTVVETKAPKEGGVDNGWSELYADLAAANLKGTVTTLQVISLGLGAYGAVELAAGPAALGSFVWEHAPLEAGVHLGEGLAHQMERHGAPANESGQAPWGSQVPMLAEPAGTDLTWNDLKIPTRNIH